LIGQWEREAIGERTAAALQHKASQGEYTGGAAPYGYALAADGVALVEIATEQAVIAEARALRASGMSLRKISEALGRKGLRARNPRRCGALAADPARSTRSRDRARPRSARTIARAAVARLRVSGDRDGAGRGACVQLGPERAARWLAGDVAQELGRLAEGGSNLDQLAGAGAAVERTGRCARGGGGPEELGLLAAGSSGDLERVGHQLGGDRGAGVPDPARRGAARCLRRSRRRRSREAPRPGSPRAPRSPDQRRSPNRPASQRQSRRLLPSRSLPTSPAPDPEPLLSPLLLEHAANSTNAKVHRVICIAPV
jgi:hypothetical protein